MSITIIQAVLLGLCIGIWKCALPYTLGAFNGMSVLFNAAIVGLIMGDVPHAMMIGAGLQLVFLGVISTGGSQATDPGIASYVAIPIALTTGLDANAAIALAVPVGILGTQLMNLSFFIGGFMSQRGNSYIERGNEKGMARWAVYVNGLIRIVLFASVTTIALLFGSNVLQNVLNNIPSFVTNGLSAMGSCLPAVGFAIIASLISKPRYMPFFFAGFFFIQYTKISIIPMLLLGLFMTFLYIRFTKSEYVFDDREDDEDGDEEIVEENIVRLLSKKDIFKAWMKWWFLAEASHSFDRMQGASFCHAIAPSLRKFYVGEENKPRYIEALKRHMQFFNSEAHWGGGPALGLSLALEEKKASDYEAVPGEMIVNLKTSLMGPLAGVGDTITWSTLMYLFIGMFLPLAEKGNILGGIMPGILMTIYGCGVGYFLTYQSYKYGYSFAEKMLESGIINMIIAGASVLGLFMMGGLAATYVTVSTPLEITLNTFSATVQSIFDSILPGILPLALVMAVWAYLSKVKRNYLVATIGVTIFAMVFGAFGIIA